MSQKRIQIPPRLGGGDFVMREISCGEHEDALKRSAGGDDSAWVDRQAEQVCASLAEWRGKALPVGSDREAWWRANGAAMRQFLLGCYNKMNTTSDKEIEDFFGAAEVVAAPPTTR